jgi:glycosyltransferase involved in cell wall biosynthesis
MAEILTSMYKYNVKIFTSNALDFRALRDPMGRIIKPENRFFNKVNALNINRFPIKYDISENLVIQKLKNIEYFNDLKLYDDCIKKFLRNGPYLEELIDFFLFKNKIKYDLIHTTFFPYFNLIISLLIGRMMNVPTVCTPFFHFANPRYSDLFLIDVLQKFDLIIACTYIEKQTLIEKCGIKQEKVTIIPMGVDYQKFKRTSETKIKANNFKERFFNKKEQKYKLVLYCGYKNYEKGAISILKSIPYILKKIKHVYFVFIGPSTKAYNHELSKIQKLKYTRIINFTPDNLTGYYDKKKIKAFQEADVYLMPSRSDAFGISFLEAWAAGVPVIGAREGATPEVIRENIDGLLVEFDNPLDIAQKVITLLKKNRIKKEMGIAGQVRVFQKLTWDIVAEKTHQVYQSLLNT